MTPEVKERIEQIRHGIVPEGYKKTGVGIIPHRWDLCALNSVMGNLEAGTSVNSDPSKDTGRYVLKTSAVFRGNVNLDEAKPVLETDIDRLKCPVQKGCIMISRMNTPALVGECGYVKESSEVHFLPDRLGQATNISPETCDFVWLNQLLNYERYSSAIHSMATGTSNSMKNISKESFLGLTIACPSLVEQQRISEILTTQDKVIDQKTKLLAEKQRQKKYLTQQLLTGKKRLPGFDGEWRNVKLNEVLVERKEKNANQDHRICSVAVQKGVVDQIEHLGRSYAAADTSNYGVAHYGDIIYTKSPTGDFPYGIIKQSQMNEEVAVSPLYGIYEPVCYEMGYLLHTYFSYAANCSNYLLPIIQKGAKNTINITNDVFVSNKLYLPMEQGEQKALAEIFITADSEIELLRQSIEQEKQKKKALMQLLLPGIVRV